MAIHRRLPTWATPVGLIFTAVALSACGGTAGPDPVTPASCTAPEGLSISDIESVTDWINAMPKPLTLPCFIESLPRPLAVNITHSVFSAQPANGARNPRVLIMRNDLILSVVTQEASKPNTTEPPKNLLELSYRTTGIHSIKAELVFPVTEHLPYSAAYVTTLFTPNLSSCGVCHALETQVGDFDGIPVRESQMLAPYSNLRVTLDFLLNEQQFCDPQHEAHRCAMLDALVGEGDIVWRNFPSGVPTL